MKTDPESRSYVNVRLGLIDRLREHVATYRFRRAAERSEVATLVRQLNANARTVEALLGGKLENRKILEIGPGQLLKQARFFGAANEVTAMDTDYIGQGGLGDLWRTWRSNGSVRLVKTLGRKILGFDRRLIDALAAEVPGSRKARIQVVQGDATASGFPAESFDVTMSYSVLEHIPRPGDVLDELVRVTRRHGVFFHVIHLYTSNTGAHDPRSFVEDFSVLPAWCHLRADCAGQSRPNCYVNKVRLAEWRRLVAAHLPGATTEMIPESPPDRETSELALLRQRGELADYSDEELFTAALIVSWRKP